MCGRGLSAKMDIQHVWLAIYVVKDGFATCIEAEKNLVPTLRSSSSPTILR